MGRQSDPFVPLAGQLRDDVVGFALVLPLANDDLHLLGLLPQQIHGVRGVEHGAEDLLLLAHHSCPQIPLVDVVDGIMGIAVLEEDALDADLHQILIAEEADAGGLQQDDLVLGQGHGDRIQRG